MSETSYDCIEEESERDGENVVSGEEASENSEEEDIEGEGDDDSGSWDWAVSATAVNVAPATLAKTPATFQYEKKSWPIYTDIAKVNKPDVAERTVFDVTEVIDRL